MILQKFFIFPPCQCQNGNQIRKPTASFHATPSQIHYSLIILPLDAMQSVLLELPLNDSKDEYKQQSGGSASSFRPVPIYLSKSLKRQLKTCRSNHCQFIIHSYSVCPLNVAEVTSVSKAIGYELRSMQGEDFSLSPRPDRMCCQSSLLCHHYHGLIMNKARSVQLTTHQHLVPRLTIRRASPPLRHTSLR